MIKYLLLLAAAYLLWRFWLGRDAGDARPAASASEAMVRCAHCGVFLPESDALAADGKHFCNAEHRQAARPPQG